MPNNRNRVRPVEPIIPGRPVDIQLGGTDPDRAFTYDLIRLLEDDVGQMGGAASIFFPATTVTGTTSLNPDQVYIRADASGGAFTITLPPLASVPDERPFIIIKKVDTTANPVTVAGNGSETMDGSATVTITMPMTSYWFVRVLGIGWDIN